MNKEYLKIRRKVEYEKQILAMIPQLTNLVINHGYSLGFAAKKCSYSFSWAKWGKRLKLVPEVKFACKLQRERTIVKRRSAKGIPLPKRTLDQLPVRFFDNKAARYRTLRGE